MTDRYLFRGFHPCENGTESVWIEGKEIKGRWVYGGFVKARNHWTKNGIHEDWIIASASQNGGWFTVNQRYPVLPETVGQYTGLTDKNGNKVYEGDILKLEDYRELTTVEFEDNRYEYAYYRCFGFDVTGCEKDNFEVLGNIHSNPDILERKENEE